MQYARGADADTRENLKASCFASSDRRPVQWRAETVVVARDHLPPRAGVPALFPVGWRYLNYMIRRSYPTSGADFPRLPSPARRP